ncbi:MAG: hypothetical protein SRB1_01201 [Desulfobacteraceae bacterium Eth-SRB1]|nr:MAG: hypothetical protein SRB1_01201 [Desulfobacteraceae bacterium Eth-SRB1]
MGARMRLFDMFLEMDIDVLLHRERRTTCAQENGMTGMVLSDPRGAGGCGSCGGACSGCGGG